MLTEITIDEAGRVSHATIVETADERLDAAVLEAVRAFEFEPARKAGVSVAVTIRYRYVIEPEAPEPPPPVSPAPIPLAPTGSVLETARSGAPECACVRRRARRVRCHGRSRSSAARADAP